MKRDKFALLMSQIVMSCIVLGLVAFTVWFIIWLFT